MVRVIQKAASKWKELAISLGVDYSLVKSIEYSKSNCKDCCIEILNEWLEARTRIPVNWGTLITALQEVQLNFAAKELKLVLLEGTV